MTQPSDGGAPSGASLVHVVCDDCFPEGTDGTTLCGIPVPASEDWTEHGADYEGPNGCPMCEWRERVFGCSTCPDRVASA